MDINGTAGNDSYTQSVADKDIYITYYGKAGDDTIKLYQGTVLGEAGNDRIEILPSTDFWRQIAAAYWTSPAAVTVDLAQGYAFDGFGTRDTLIGVNNVTGSGFDDHLYGNANDNTFYSGEGNSLVDGRDGDDLVVIPAFSSTLKVDDLRIDVAIDAKSATIRYAPVAGYLQTLQKIERIEVGSQIYTLSDFIKPLDMAQQALLANDVNRWNAGSGMGSHVTLTFSFVESAPASGVGANHFQAFTAAQRDAVRQILSATAQFSGITFQEVADGASNGGSHLRFGASEQSSTKGVSSMPGEANAGQVWMDLDSVANLTPGGAGYAALLHEIGHALGLRHPRNVDAADAWAFQLREQDDVTSQSVMSGTASPDGLFPASWSTLDVTALRLLYGSAQVATGDTRYLLGASAFQAETCIIDDGGTDTLDCSQSRTGVTLDLQPGHLSSVGATPSGRSAQNNLSLALTTTIENAVGSEFDDVIKGNDLDNRLTGGLGNDLLDGGNGIDSAVFAANRSDYLLSSSAGKVFVAARDGVSGYDSLQHIEKLVFADQTVLLGSSAFGADVEWSLDQNGSTSGTLPAATDEAASLVSYRITTAPAHGSLNLAANGAYSYTPAHGYSGADSFSFTLFDASHGSNLYMGFITVNKVSVSQNGSEGSDQLTGSSGDDQLSGNGGADSFVGTTGDDLLNGGSGFDTVRYGGARASFTLVASTGDHFSLRKPGQDGLDSLQQIERVQFDDLALALDIAGNGGQAYRLYQAAFDRKPDLSGLGFWINALDHGSTLNQVSANFMQSDEFKALYGGSTPATSVLVTKLYQNVLHRAPDAGGFAYWSNILDSHAASAAQVVSSFSESAENQAQVIAAIKNGIDYLPFA